MAFIIIEKGNSEDIGRVFALGQNNAVIGRPTPGGDPDIVIHEDYVSRNHAEISYDQGGFTLRDIGSTNGTEIDGQRIAPGIFYSLTHDSIIGLGVTPGGASVVLRFKESDATKPIKVVAALEMGDARLVGWLKIDEERKDVWVDGKLLTLPRKEYDLLAFLYRKAGKVCSRDEIIADVWPEVEDPGAVSDAAIDQLVHRLRERIEPDPSKPSRIISKKTFGYMLV